MRKIILVLISATLVVSYFSVATTVKAQGGQFKPVEESALSTLTMDCLDVKKKISAVHQQDGLLRVNAGSAYDDISNKLIAKLNSKVASESLDGADLISNASSVRENRKQFDESYQVYELAMYQLLKSDCQSRQQQFYEDLQEVQQMRSDVYGSMNRTNQSIDNYYTSFEQFKQEYLRDQEEAERFNDEE